MAANLQRQSSIITSSWHPSHDAEVLQNAHGHLPSTDELANADSKDELQQPPPPPQQQQQQPSVDTLHNQTSTNALLVDTKTPPERVYVGEEKPANVRTVTSTTTGSSKMRPEGKYDRWIVLTISCIGGLLAAIQSNALVIAFPTLIAQLQSDITTILWVLLAFLLVVAAVVPVTGKLGDMFGQPFLFNCGFLLFTIASLLSGFSQVSAHGNDLIGYRVVLGFGGTFLFANSVAILTDVFAPHGQVGLSQGVFQVAFACGAVLGPVVGGGLAEQDWRWIFWYNVPPAGICTILGFYFIRNRKPRPAPIWTLIRSFDYLGSILIIEFLTLLILALTQAVLPDPNLSSPTGLGVLIGLGGAGFIAFCFWETYLVKVGKSPIVDLRIFSNKVFTLSTVASIMVAFGRGNVTYAMIFLLQGPFGDDPLTAGLKLIPLGLGIVVTGLVSGILADRMGVRNLCVLGSIVALLGCVGLALIKLTDNYWLLAFALFVVGCGQGLFNSPNGVAGMMAVKGPERGIASAIRLCLSFLPQMVGIVITFALILNSLTYAEILQVFIYGGGGLSQAAVDSFMHAIDVILWITVAAHGVAAIVSAFIPGSFNPLREMREAMANKAAKAQAKEAQISATADVEAQTEPKDEAHEMRAVEGENKPNQ